MIIMVSKRDQKNCLDAWKEAKPNRTVKQYHAQQSKCAKGIYPESDSTSKPAKKSMRKPAKKSTGKPTKKLTPYQDCQMKQKKELSKTITDKDVLTVKSRENCKELKRGYKPPVTASIPASKKEEMVSETAIIKHAPTPTIKYGKIPKEEKEHIIIAIKNEPSKIIGEGTSTKTFKNEIHNTPCAKIEQQRSGISKIITDDFMKDTLDIIKAKGYDPKKYQPIVEEASKQVTADYYDRIIYPNTKHECKKNRDIEKNQ